MKDGRVSLVAKDATVRQILAEWAKVGQTRIVNGERVNGGPVNLQLTNVPERDALDVVLRSVSGYVAAPRAVPLANVSRFDRIIVMPTSAAPPASGLARARGGLSADGVALHRAAAAGGGSGAGAAAGGRGASCVQPFNRAGVFNPYPQPQIVNPQPGVQPAQGPLVLPQAGAPVPSGAAPTSPFGGVSVPGMIAPAPPQPGQPQAPGQVRRPGGPGGSRS